MSKKQDVTKLAFFSESTLQRMQIEINRVSQLYRAERIRGHEMLHAARKDAEAIYWHACRVIASEHAKIDFLHKVKRSMEVPQPTGQYLTRPTLEALDNFALASKLYRTGLSDFGILKKAGTLARRLLRIDTICLRTDISDLIRKARKFTPQPEEFVKAEELDYHSFDDTQLSDMEVKKFSQAQNKAI